MLSLQMYPFTLILFIRSIWELLISTLKAVSSAPFRKMQHTGAFNRINMVFSYFLQYIRCCTAVIHTYLKYSDTSIQTNKKSSYLGNNCSGGGNLSVLWLQITFYGFVRTFSLEFFFSYHKVLKYWDT